MPRFAGQLAIVAILFTSLLLIVPPGLGESVGDILLHAAATVVVAVVVQSFRAPLKKPHSTTSRYLLLAGAGVAWGTASWLLMRAVMILVTYIWSQSAQQYFPIYSLDSIRLWIAIPVQLLVGVREELVFRGFLQPKLMAVSGSTLGAIAGTATLFAAAHLPLGIGIAGFALIGGVLFGGIRTVHNSVLPAGIAHGVYNCLVLILM